MMSLNESSLENTSKRKEVNHKQIPKIHLYIGELDSDKEHNLDTAVNSFNSTFESEEKYQQVSAYYEPIENNSSKESKKTQNNRYKLLLEYKTERDEKAKYFLRNYYPFFIDFFTEGTIFIDYLYVVILNMGGQDIPFIINGPIINLREDSFEIIHYPRLIPIDFFPFIPGIHLDNLKKIKNEYKSRFLGFDLDKKTIDSADVSKLYKITLKDDIALVGIKFDNSKGEKCFKSLDKNRRDFFIEESLFKKLNEKKSDIVRIDKEKNNESNINDLTIFLSSIIDEDLNASNNKQDKSSDKEIIESLTTTSQDSFFKPIGHIINYTETIFYKENTKNSAAGQSLSGISVNYNPHVGDNKGDPVISGEVSLPKYEENPAKKKDNENTPDISFKENLSDVTKKKTRAKRKVKVNSSSATKKTKVKDAVSADMIKSKKNVNDLNSKINSTPNPNTVSPRKHVFCIVTLILLLCMLIWAWHSQEEVKNIYFKLYNGITENHSTRADIQELSNKTNSDNTEHSDLKSDLLNAYGKTGQIKSKDKVEIMQNILIKAGFNQKLDNMDWKNTKENVRQYLKMNSVQFDEEHIGSITESFKYFETLYSSQKKNKP